MKNIKTQVKGSTMGKTSMALEIFGQEGSYNVPTKAEFLARQKCEKS